MEEVLNIYWFSGSTCRSNAAGPSVICVAHVCKTFRFQGGRPHTRQFGAHQSQLFASFVGKVRLSGGSKCDASSGFIDGCFCLFVCFVLFSCRKKEVILSHTGTGHASLYGKGLEVPFFWLRGLNLNIYITHPSTPLSALPWRFKCYDAKEAMRDSLFAKVQPSPPLPFFLFLFFFFEM